MALAWTAEGQKLGPCYSAWGSGMSNRLGHLVYWAACFIAIAAICLAVYALVAPGVV